MSVPYILSQLSTEERIQLLKCLLDEIKISNFMDLEKFILNNLNLPLIDKIVTDFLRSHNYVI